MLRLPNLLRNRLVFIRHGETDWNAEGRLQGQRDVPLNPRGHDQALAAGRRLKQWLGPEADAALAEMDFLASPLQRARQTMELVCIGLGQPGRGYRLDDRLKELSFGAWEGLTWLDLKRRDPEAVKGRQADKWGFVPPDGESYALLAERVEGWLATLEGDTLAVSHGGVARVLMHLLAGAPADTVCEEEIVQGRVLVFAHGRYFWV